ncbi:M24 family metallopeptidase [Candidatus Omnitrophota bacterium]
MISRLERLRSKLNKRGVDSILLSHPANISYLTDFPTQDSYLLANKNKCLLITDSRYSSEYRHCLKTKAIEVLETSKKLPQTLKIIDEKLQIKSLAFEQEHLSFFLYQKLKSSFGKRLTPTKEVIESMRIIKDAAEIKLIKKALSITLDALKFTKKILKPGIKELELAAEIERYIRLKGATNTSFDIIVASGPHSALPHARKTQRKIRNNEPVLIDMGVEYKGYKSDLTRVFFLGKMDTLFRKVYSIVQTAQQKARDSIRPGVSIEYIDRVARQHITKKGFGKFFKHSLGHGIGLETHELPKISSKNKNKLRPGMLFTLEPGIYLDNKFGVRIEDMVLVTKKGKEILSGSAN